MLANGAQRRSAATAIRNVAGAALGVLMTLAPQFVTWKSTFGSWIVNSYGQEFAFTWRHPHLLDILMRNPAQGVVIWLPLLTVGVLGCLRVGVRRVNALALGAAVAWMINLYVISSWWAWASIAQRAAFDSLLPIGLGVGALLTELAGRWQPAVIVVLAALIAWSVPFASIGVPETASRTTLLAAWWHCLRALLRLSGPVI